MKTLSAKVGAESVLLIQGARGKINGEGEFLDKKVLKEIDVLINSFIESMQ